MVLGDKEDRRNDRGGWRAWAVGPDGIKFGSAGVFKWLRNDLVRVLVRPATGVCSAEVAASFGDVQSSALRELMHYLLRKRKEERRCVGLTLRAVNDTVSWGDALGWL